MPYGLKKGANGKYAKCPGNMHANYRCIQKNTWGTKGPIPARQIADIIDRIPHEKYVEPFLGHGYVYRARQNPAQKEVLNDKDCKQVGIARTLTCQTKDKEKCERLKIARVTCRRDWKAVTRQHCNDSKTLCYLDPPYSASNNIDQNDKLSFKQSKGIHPSALRNATRKLKSSVLISYNDNPQAVKILCKKPFRCRRVQKKIVGDRWYTEILAVKKAGRR